MSRNGGDDRLEQFEIEDRNALIAEAIAELKAFDEFVPAKLYITQYISMLEPGTPDNVEYVGTTIIYNSDWLTKVIDRISIDIKSRVCTDIVAQVGSLKVSDFILKGDASSVATKLSLLYFTGQRPSAYENITSDLACELGGYQWGREPFNFKFYDFVDGASKLYELSHMRYRLWDKRARGYLSRFLFIGFDGAYEGYECGALCEDDDTDISRSGFIEIVEQEIIDVPRLGNTHISFPEQNFSSEEIIFSEYLPFRKMDSQYIDELYQLYQED